MEQAFRLEKDSRTGRPGAIRINHGGATARYGETAAYFPHAIQSPPIKALYVNDRNIAGIGMCAYKR
jgi:hypothetical protein